LADQWQQMIQWLRELSAPLERWYPLIASALTLVSGFCKGPLRFAILSLAILFFLSVAADFARSLLEKDSGYASVQGPPTITPVTPLQIILATLFAIVYSFMIFAGLHLMFFPASPGFLVLLPCIFVLSFLAAWRNVRLWYRQAIDYEQALNEEAQAHDVHVPPAPLQ
jgi:uncharacterized membrane protein